MDDNSIVWVHVGMELARQTALHGEHPLPDGMEAVILAEEILEAGLDVMRSVQDKPHATYEELIQCAAVALRWADKIK